MKNVLHVIEAYANTGLGVGARQCAQAIRMRGWDVTFLAPYFLIDVYPGFEKIKISRKELATPWRLAKIFNRFDIIHHHTPNFGHIQYFTDPPSVFHLWGLPPRVYGKWYYYVYTPEGGFYLYSKSLRARMIDLYNYLMLKAFAYKYSSIIAVSKYSKYEADTVLRTGNVDMVYVGVNTSSFRPNLEPRFKRGSPQYLYVGDLSPRKGVEVLLYAMKHVIKKMPKAHLMIVGEGILRKYLTGLVSNLGLNNNVEFVGFVPYDLIPYYYASCDAFVTAERHSYFTQPVLEALASGKPVVVPNLHVFPEIYADSKVCLMFRWNDPEGLSGKMIEVLRFSEDLKGRAVEYAKRFTWDNAANEIIKIYERCLNA